MLILLMSLILESGSRNCVVISRLFMRDTKVVNNIIREPGKYFTLDGITLQQAGEHLIQMAGDQDANLLTFRICVL